MNRTLVMLLTFVLLSVVALAQPSPPSVPTACNVGSLPEGIQNRLKEEIGAWGIQQPENLSEDAHIRWKSEKPIECPGIAIGQFRSGRAPSYAILLVSHAKEKGGYELIAFTPGRQGSSYELTVLDHSADGEASNLFIHRELINKFFDERSRRKFEVEADDAILFADAGQKEYETDLYFWGKGGFQHQPVDY